MKNALKNTVAACATVLIALASQNISAKNVDLPMTSPSSTTSTLLYIGTYTGKGSEGIYRFRLDNATAKLHPEGLAAKVSNPSFLALAPDQKHLYCINEIENFHEKRSGAATSFSVDHGSGELKQIDQAVSGGTGGCYISVTPDGKAVLVANYGSGSVALLPISGIGGLEEPTSVAQHEGSSVVAKRQSAPHAHCIRPDPSGRFAVAVDLGIDQIIAYRLATDSQTMDTSAPIVNKTTAGAGPRHIAFHPNGKLAFVSNELNSTITAYEWSSENGTLTEIVSTSTLPANFDQANYPAEVLVHPSGRFVYLSNRGHNSVAVFEVDPETGEMTTAGHEPTRGDHPRGMSLSPSGEFLIVANQDTGSLVVYRINQDTGMPEFADQYEGINRPTGIQFL